MKLIFSPIIYTVRVYEDSEAEINKDRYIAVFTAQRMENKLYISAYHGEYSLKIRRLIRDWCLENGIDSVDFSTITDNTYTITRD